MLTTKHLSFKTRGQVFVTYVRSAMLHGSETWAPKAEELQRLRRNDRSMIRWICGVRPEHELSSADLLLKLGIKEISTVLRERRLRWFGHVQRSPACINTVADVAVPGTRGAGRPRKTWRQCVKDDRRACGLDRTNPLDRDAWRAGVRRSLVLPTPPDPGNTAAR